MDPYRERHCWSKIFGMRDTCIPKTCCICGSMCVPALFQYIHTKHPNTDDEGYACCLDEHNMDRSERLYYYQLAHTKCFNKEFDIVDKTPIVTRSELVVTKKIKNVRNAKRAIQ